MAIVAGIEDEKAHVGGELRSADQTRPVDRGWNIEPGLSKDLEGLGWVDVVDELNCIKSTLGATMVSPAVRSCSAKTFDLSASAARLRVLNKEDARIVQAPWSPNKAANMVFRQELGDVLFFACVFAVLERIIR